MTSTQYPPVVKGGLPLVGHAVSFLKKPLDLLKKGYEEHGDMYTLKLGNDNAVVMLGPQHHKFFFNQTDKLLDIKEGYPFFVRMFNEHFYFLGDYESYTAQRSLIIPCFKNTQMPDYVDIMLYETHRFMQKIGDEGEFDLLSEFGPLVMNIAAHSFLGKDFREKLGVGIFDDFREFSEGMDPVLPGWLPIPKFMRSQKAKKKLHGILGKLIKERRQSPVETRDFLQTLSESTYENGKAVEDEVLINLILLLVWAGHETTAGHISWGLIDLLQNPTFTEKLLAQQQEVLGKKLHLTMDDLKQLKHIDHALKETERLHPVAYVLFRSANETFDYNGYTIPKDTKIFIAPWVAHLMPDVFEQPNRFMPERFAQKQENYSLVGFGGGVHRCAGVNFAYLEMRVLLTILLQYYDFELMNKDPQPLKGAKTKWPEPTKVRYKKRANAVNLAEGITIGKSVTNKCPFH